ncbi:Mur ligase [Microdochium trichocladiopsis]|uniref:Folylpolyglutamate synthase n=1 Tax=Microdochium trichocladiopsis TaxID=1682393 RepID=A0A9P9BJP8_9PEZI|nr:Mur ligase [Microdochium trichocladiopsis]KAH7018363.1 Mur ligase [Microdochium trichocladiopsis]
MLARLQSRTTTTTLKTGAFAFKAIQNASATAFRTSGQLRLDSFLAMARTYDGALARLASLQSNKAITALFDPPAASTTDNSKPVDLNALAIPEMLGWLERAGLSASDLARLRCIHVAGTKGKGSVCAYLTSILTQPSARSVAGLVGTYTSPHLVTVRERIQLDGRPISQQLFARYFFEVWDAFTASARSKATRDSISVSEEDLEGPGTKPFFFRFLTIMAFHAFLREGVKSAVIECGIGGEYDSTNILPMEAVTTAVVTQLGIDHVGMLGGTLPEIAWHKAGICKKDRACFTRRLAGGDEQERTMQVLRERAKAAQARLLEVPDEEVQQWSGVNRSEAASSLAGSFQKYNQALAVGAALEHMALLSSSDQRPDEVSKWLQDVPGFFKDGLLQAHLRGRCETREDNAITWFIDGAHTAESLQGTARWFSSSIGSVSGAQRILVFNQQDRDVTKLLQDLLDGIENDSRDTHFDYAIFTTNEFERAQTDLSPTDTSVQHIAMTSMKVLSPATDSRVSRSVEEAIRDVRGLANTAEKNGQKTVVLVTGSLHLVSAFLRCIEPGEDP